ncbi:MAG: hypothetical protein KME49_27180 [Brasilonema octagenarum HA4186-MV1]|jgi:hypothetical protein|uniref:Uncharacterized protein n=2 Tax=Brasilonema TaxID=383614 RepID=A0A856MKS5_9CYAN|nr:MULTISPECIES: hypothetical protein [Brasilonema]MBW4629089.1 hypothetical protein [Brasilonema octagenarum HA4186-MV1]NMF64409.1 hypothetical protein [Brasilonema octagenarum UFV-OR1]QDL11142.1 hypothetical protein DP114_27520 [Brasilonema sennae CENA114]QDL17488.1 hypothetical protein DP113_27450 [Brasilonema octagenarum UFV-E1]
MNLAVELPSGKILNLSRFIALIPLTTTSNNYNLILEGYSAPITLEPDDAEALKKLLQLDKDLVTANQLELDRQKRLKQNQRAIALLKQRIQRHENMSEAESLHREEIFENFKQIIDAERFPEQKLYSQS